MRSYVRGLDDAPEVTYPLCVRGIGFVDEVGLREGGGGVREKGRVVRYARKG
jgi:hypothetical protein